MILSSMSARDVEAEPLKTKSFECLGKSKNSGCMVVPIVLDDTATNCKVLKDAVKSTNETDDENKLPDVALKCEPCFMCNDEKYFVMFCLPHMVNCLSNNCMKKDDHFKCPKLVLSTGHTLEVEICTFKWIKKLHENKKNEIISSVRLKKSTVSPSDLDK